VGAPDVEVRFENQPIGHSNARGQLLLPGLRAYERNHISIDPMSLPVDARIPILKQYARPRWKSGVSVDFGVALNPRTALVTIRDEDGQLLPVGTHASLNDGEMAIVGYDGQIWLEHIALDNRLIVQPEGAPACTVTFTAPAALNERLVIPDAVCRRAP